MLSGWTYNALVVLLIKTVTYPLSTLGNHTFGVIQGAEQYEIIKNGFGVVRSTT